MLIRCAISSIVKIKHTSGKSTLPRFSSFRQNFVFKIACFSETCWFTTYLFRSVLIDRTTFLSFNSSSIINSNIGVSREAWDVLGLLLVPLVSLPFGDVLCELLLVVLDISIVEGGAYCLGCLHYLLLLSVFVFFIILVLWLCTYFGNVLNDFATVTRPESTKKW